MISITRAHQRMTNGNDFLRIEVVYPGINLENPMDLGLGPLGKFDHITVRPGVVVSMHPHKNDEILTYLQKGTLIHEDSEGYTTSIHSKNLMLISAGQGILVEESNPEERQEIVEGLQIFIRPEKADLEPKIQFYKINEDPKVNEWRLIAGPKGSNAPMEIRSYIKVYDAKVMQSTLQLPKVGDLTGYLYVYDGIIMLNRNKQLSKGDGIIARGKEVELSVNEEAHIMFFLLDENAEYTRSGIYSG